MSPDRYTPTGALVAALQQASTDEGSHEQDRRDPLHARPWHVHEVSSRVGTFLATNRMTGRSFRLPVGDRAQAELQVAMLNRTVVELHA